MVVTYYSFYSLYIATCFDAWMTSCFSILFTALFPLCVGAFEQDISKETALNHPAAYYYFKYDSKFNLKYFFFWMWTALWQSLAFFGISIMIYYDHKDIWYNNGINGGLPVCGTQCMTATVIVICLKMMSETNNGIYYII